jgi:prepilin-type processing-associated H-X9-DG protein
MHDMRYNPNGWNPGGTPPNYSIPGFPAPQISALACPSDNGIALAKQLDGYGNTTYSSNFQVFGNTPHVSYARVGDAGPYSCLYMKPTTDPSGGYWDWSTTNTLDSITDGISNTILFAERYASCNNGGGGKWNRPNYDVWQPMFAGWQGWTGPPSSTVNTMFQDSPTTTKSGGTCNLYVAQTPHSGVMNACFADGTVHALSSAMNGNVWWALITPRGGETIPSTDL